MACYSAMWPPIESCRSGFSLELVLVPTRLGAVEFLVVVMCVGFSAKTFSATLQKDGHSLSLSAGTRYSYSVGLSLQVGIRLGLELSAR